MASGGSRPRWHERSAERDRAGLADLTNTARRQARGVGREKQDRPTDRYPGVPDAWQGDDPFAADEQHEPMTWAGLGSPTVRSARRGSSRPPGAGEAAPAWPEHRDAAGAGHDQRRGRGRAAAARRRKSQRRLYAGTAAAVAAAGIGIGVWQLTAPGPQPGPHYITTLQTGEYRSVPSACTAVSQGVLNRYLPGPARKVTPAIETATQSQCSFTVDAKPVFRVLNVDVEAYQPSLVAAGNGSATANATDTFGADRYRLAHPAKHSAAPPATVSILNGVGGQAFAALQVFRASGMVSDLVTVEVRTRNVIVTSSLEGQESGHGFGPVSVASLRAGALAAARDVLARVATQPTG